MTDTLEETTSLLLSTTDASVWAKEFVERFGGDEGNMIGWFANAIETGRNAGLSDFATSVDRWARECWQTAEDHNWHDPREVEGVVRNASTAERLALIHSEISEGLEEVRKGRYGTWYSEGDKPEGLMIELADACIRIGDLAKIIKDEHPESPTLGEAIVEKREFNEGRSSRHGGKLL